MPAAKKPRARPAPWAILVLLVSSAFTLGVLVLIALDHSPL